MRNFQDENLQKGQLYEVSPLTPSNNLPDELKEVNDGENVGSQSSISELHRQLQRLWMTDFKDTNEPTKPAISVEDERARHIMEDSLKLKNGHYQVALPW